MRVLPMLLAKEWPELATDGFALASAAALSIVMLAVYALLVRLLERRAAHELSLSPGASLAIGGALLGFTLFLLVFLVFAALGIAYWDGAYNLLGLAPAFALAITSGVGEELVFRGGIFRVLEDSFGTLIALVFSAAIFGLIHGANPSATTLSTVAIALEAGALLALAYAATRNLWFPIGLHFGWNFTEGGLFGAAVSGNQMKGAMAIPLSGPDLLTGGAFGPEASIVAVAVCLAAALVLAIITVRTGRWMKPRFRLMLD
jgi:membrane protease YdiL (CAAX protease family)